MIKLYKGLVTGLVIAVLIVILAPVRVWAAPVVLVNGHYLALEIAPQIYNNRVMVPLSSIFKALGAEVTWLADTQTILGKKDTSFIVLQIGKSTAIVNGNSETLDSPPVIFNGRTLIPLSFVASSLGARVAWDEPTETVSIMLENKPVPDVLKPNELYKQLEPAVLTIVTFTSTDDFWGYGDGLVVSSEGKILTNFALIDGAAWACIEMPDKSILITGGVGGWNKEHDVAILKFPARPDFKPAKIGDSDTLATGDRIFVIGCPFGLSRTMSDGLVSSANRTIDGRKLIQVSAPMDFSTMGGFLFNTRGELVGLNYSTWDYLDAQELNFATPINDLKDLIASNEFVPIRSVASDYFYDPYTYY